MARACVKVHGRKKVADRSAILAFGSQSEPRRSGEATPIPKVDKALARPSRLATVGAMVVACLVTLAQAAIGATGPPPEELPLPPEELSAPAAEPEEQVVEVRIVGNQTVSTAKVMAQLRTRSGRPFDPERVQNDVRKLAKLGWFIDIQPLYERVPGGRVVIFRVTERATLRWAQYLGNRKIRDKVLAKETGLKVGDAMDPYAVEEGRRKIEELYRGRGFNNVQVTILDGNKNGDKGATFVIHEGRAQRVRTTRFIGNTIASDARLKTQIQSKHGFMWLFRGYVDRVKIDEDVDRLTAYYRSLGFFRARVSRYLSFNDAESWLTLTFVIHEGPRFKVGEVSFLGNEQFTSQHLAEQLNLKDGQFFRQADMNRDLEALRDLYGGDGYVFADIQADPRYLPDESGRLDLVYHVEEGKRYRVGEITVNIQGENPHTRVRTILNRLSLRTGDIVDIRKIRADERRLRLSGLFLNDPARGAGPRIVFTPPDLMDESVAGRPQRKRGAFRGQSPDDERIDLTLKGQLQPLPPATPSPPHRQQGQPPYGASPPRPDPRSAAPSPTHGQQSQPPYPISLPRPDPRSAVVIRGQSPHYGAPPQPQTSPVTTPYGGQPMGSLGPGSQPYTAYQTPPAATYPTYPNPPGGPQTPSVGAGPVTPSPFAAGPPMPPPPASVPPGAAGGYQLFPDGSYGPGSATPFEPSLPLEVQLEETQTGRFMLGVGVNSQAGVVGSAVIEEQNFNLFRLPTSFEDFRNGTAFRGRGQRFRLELMPGSRVQRYLVNFEDPYLWDTPITLGLSAFYFDRRYFDWDEQRVGGRVALGYQLSPDLSASLAYRGENVRVYNPRVPGVPQLEEALGTNSLHGFKLSMTHDTRDSAFLATQGHFLQAGIEQVIGTFEYPRLTGDFRKYFLMHERPDRSGRHVLSMGTRFGLSGSDTPIYDNFFAGGFSTLRGFDFRGASPRTMGVFVGGRFMFINTVEYLMPVTADDMLRAVVFCDFGTVEEDIEINTFRVAPGFGLRVTVPALGPAPIALDFAFPIVTASTDDTRVFSFNVGLQR
jgi:outer membrane protein insertion porin family